MREWKAFLICLVALAVSLVSLPPVSAQSLTGTLRGVVVDPQSQVVPGVTITLTSESTCVSQTTTSSSVGVYDIPNLAAGTYKLHDVPVRL